jgi:hypothetical protein
MNQRPQLLLSLNPFKNPPRSLNQRLKKSRKPSRIIHKNTKSQRKKMLFPPLPPPKVMLLLSQRWK